VATCSGARSAPKRSSSRSNSTSARLASARHPGVSRRAFAGAPRIAAARSGIALEPSRCRLLDLPRRRQAARRHRQDPRTRRPVQERQGAAQRQHRRHHRPGARQVAGHQGRSSRRAVPPTNPDLWNPHRVPLRAARKVVVVDPENGRIGARRNERHIDGRPGGARGLHRVVAALCEYGTVRKARPVRLRAAV
jgi:hypothetical protein